MNDNLSPIGIHPDEHLEARITAFILGEASPFEAAEIEELIEKSPELKLFANRTRTLNSLLKEAEITSNTSDPEWKLPAQKRNALASHLDPVPIPIPRREKRIRRASIRAAFAIAAVFVVTLFIIRLLPSDHEAEAIIEIKPRGRIIDPLGDVARGATTMTPQFFGTEFEKIKSRKVLEQVVDNLDLTARWNTDKESAINELKDSIETENLKGTDLIAIRVRQPDEQDAREITREITNGYRDYRQSLEKKLLEKGLAEFKKAVRDQEDKVEEARKILTTISRTKNLVSYGDRSSQSGSGLDENATAGLALNQYTELEGEKMQLESQIKSLQKYDDEQLAIYASGLDLPDNIVKTLYPQYLQQKREVEALKAQGIGKIHPSMVANERALNSLKENLDEGTINLRNRLQGQLDMTMDRLAKVELKKNESKQEALERSIDTQDYVDAKRDFEKNQGLLDQMRLKLISAEIDDSISEDSIVIHEIPPASETEVAAIAKPSSRMAAPAAMASAESAPQIHIGGQVRQPGPDTFREGMTLGDAVANAGGSTEFGSDERIRLYRDGKAQTYDLTDERLAQIELKPNDTIEIPQKNWFARGGGGDESILAEAAVTSSATASPKTTPVPSEIAQRSLEFGDGAAFGTGWAEDSESGTAGKDKSLAMNARSFRGDAGKPGNIDAFAAPFSEATAPIEVEGAGIVTDGIRSGDQGITRNSIDAVPNNSEQKKRAEPMADLKTDNNWGFDTQAQAGDTNGAIYSGIAVPITPATPTAFKSNFATPDIDVVREFIYPTEFEPGEIAIADKVPILGDVPITGRLFKNFEKNGKFDLAAAEQKLNALKAQIEEPSINDSNKQVLFRQWQELQAEAIRRQKAQTPDSLTDLSNEIPAAQEPFSTFSLNISDASFQVASSAVAKGERPDPESIKPEQFYNAVPYDDPSPSTGEPVAAAIGQAAHPIIPGRNLVRMSVRTASTGRAATQPLVLTLLVDQSGSMARADRRAAMDTALTQLATLMQPDDRITVIGFSRTPSLLADSLPGNDAEKLPDIINQSSSEGGTNLEQAIDLAENLALRHKIDGAQNRIVLFTDGAANLGNADPERLAERVKNIRQQDLAFDIAGIGTNDINDDLLSELARHGNGRYYLVGENTAGNLAKQLAGAFRPAAENVKIQVKFNPERVGNYKLIGFEKDRLKTEDFRNDSVDAAELAADESGTALYQVEPLANGLGEIGELFVRFRDTATGEMIERSWTIPYESQAPAIDKAQPQIQLATLSLLAAQKLQPGPLADAINFRDLAPTIAAVKQAYARSPEAQQMITLINALK